MSATLTLRIARCSRSKGLGVCYNQMYRPMTDSGHYVGCDSGWTLQMLRISTDFTLSAGYGVKQSRQGARCDERTESLRSTVAYNLCGVFFIKCLAASERSKNMSHLPRTGVAHGDNVHGPGISKSAKVFNHQASTERTPTVHPKRVTRRCSTGCSDVR